MGLTEDFGWCGLCGASMLAHRVVCPRVVELASDEERDAYAAGWKAGQANFAGAAQEMVAKAELRAMGLFGEECLRVLNDAGKLPLWVKERYGWA